MLEAVIVFGIVIVLGFVFIAVKLPRSVLLWLLGRHIWVDVTVSILVLWIHWGTMTGLMSAAMAGMICSIMTSLGRAAFGYTRGGKYFPPRWKRNIAFDERRRL